MVAFVVVSGLGSGGLFWMMGRWVWVEGILKVAELSVGGIPLTNMFMIRSILVG